eukprot:TRINITY_DN55549_c0_g1_i1.p1 TRINITY_DN55549_c0_g1~~TRINITY_DN55549_c0_g1_i1.p1  ORF type:complete len:345 (-),score=28.27 TRINITY_DN55549_c0_g1_i1:41-1027(-)
MAATRAQGFLLCLLSLDFELLRNVEAVQQLVQLRDQPNATHAASNCPAPGQLVFLHVMKAGGIAVDNFLHCLGTAQGWAISRHDGPPESRVPYGDTRCQPSVCTTHAPFVELGSSCGEDFASARTFTVLREPVERVWSFYNYIKASGFKPYQNRSLESLLQTFWTEDINADQSPSERCTFCHHSLANAMSLWNFVGPRTWNELASCRSVKWSGVADLCSVGRKHWLLHKAIAEAQATLASLDTIFFMEDLDQFSNLYNSIPGFSISDIDPEFAANDTSSCKVGLANPTIQKDHLTGRTKRLIRQLNWADIAVYKFARKLPNRARVKRR